MLSRSATAPPRYSSLVDFLWIPINLIQWLSILVWSVLCISVALVVLLATGSRRIPLAMARAVWAPGMLRLAWSPVEVSGTERVDFTRPHILVANHSSQLDICALFVAAPVPLHFIVKEELRRVPFLGWYIAAMGMIFVDRVARGKAYESVRRAASLIREGRTVASFPEGTRSREGSVQPFKPGVFVAAIEAGVPVVPVAILGSGSVLPPGAFRGRPGRIRVVMGDPVSTLGLTQEDRGVLAAELRARVIELMQKAPSR